MPRGHKSKHHACDKRRETHGQPQGLTGPQTTAEKQEEPHSSTISSPDYWGAHPKPSDASVPQESQGASPTGSLDAGVSCSKFDVAAKGQDEKNASTSPNASVLQGSQGVSSTGSLDAGVSCSKSDMTGLSQDEESAIASQRAAFFKTTDRDPLNRKAKALVQFLQEKFEKKEIILKADMLKRINRKYKVYFPEILKKTSDHLAVVFGVELKEMDSSGESYTLVSKLGLSGEGILSGVNGLAKSGILMSLLSFIFMRGNCATEKEVWNFLSVLGIYDGIIHSIYGEPRKIITEDLVQDKYLEYRQVCNSDPPCYEFLWGPRAHAETSKMRVLRALASINNTVPGSYPHLYEEALIDEVQRALRLRA
uniref:melanoma-associated antigen B6-like n=1 Tax=Callithrix jacchus TaxID=9483 RepID=UPI0023DCFDEF|nr:melanoma-associated antigen B6-like [Callithrix jacchus]XP_035147781.2 melanoma-associated antigen B6-like [Callithrix jacchus]XP_035147782.2 melanoma-associated antigen B6-like [Callithrix jacchus]